MKKILYIIAGLLLLFASGAAKAQISLNPSTLTWEAEESDTRYVTITSTGGGGQWECDSTLYANHFQISSQSGVSGAVVSVTPSSANTGGAIDGSVAFFNPNTGAWAVLYLLHKGPVPTFGVDPLSLSWGSTETQSKTVTVTGSGWSSSVVGSGFSRVENTSAGTITVTPDGPNAGTTARTANLQVSIGTNDKYVSLRQEASSGASVVPGSLTWAWNDALPKSVTVSSNLSWTAEMSGNGFTMVRSGNTLTFTPADGRNDTATPQDASFSVTCGNATVSGTLSRGAAPYLDGFTSNTSYIQKTTFLTQTGSSYIRDVSYYDGLGYPLQEVAVAASPTGGSIITPIVYDNMRRGDAITYLPYVRDTGTAVLDGSSDALSAQAAFYTRQCSDSHPFSVKEYGTSPLGQVKSIQKEGDAWAAGNGHKATVIRTGYAAADDVMKLRFVPLTANTPAMVIKNANDQYANGQLRKTRTTGEDGATSDAFTDALGRTVCTRTWSGANATGTASDTYYILDQRDSVVLVLQPEGAALFRNRSNDTLRIADTPSHPNNDIYREYCFSYRYEARGNRIEEHIPGGGTTRRVFDERNRLILETNDLMSATVQGDPFKAAPRYIRTVYDGLDRVTEKKVVTTSVPHLSLVERARGDNMYNVWNEGDITTWGTFYEASYYGFGNNAVSGFTPDDVATTADLETVNIKGMLESETLCQMPSADGTLPEEGSPWITRNYYYDKLGRVIQTTESDYPGWAACYSTKYDFAGRVVAKMESHRAPGDQSGQDLLTQYTYDERGRLLSISRELDGIELAPVTYAYDTLGRLRSKTFGNADDNGYGTEAFTYDIHGWATAINSLYNGSDLFREALNYASVQKPGTAARWDGNIAEAAFTDPDGSHTYAYTYDGIGRLTDAKHYAGDSNTVSSQRTEKNISYNRNGCITGLERYGAEGLSESVIFGHTGNRLSSLSSWNGAGLLENGHFTYDAMGNMLTDSRKGLEFSYNLANLPESVEGADGANLTYSYLSDGSKWRASANSGPSILYRGSFVYEDDGTSPRISSIAWDEGRISYHYAPEAVDSLVVDSGEGVVDSLEVVDVVDSLVVEDGICDEWHVRDHLGSVRAIAGIGNYITGIRELNSYLPFGTRIPGSIQAADNRHRFSGKEEQRYGSLSLGLSDFGARYYDPFTCRWTTRDPLAGKYLNLSPYNYCAGNPIILMDEQGNSPIKAVKTAVKVAKKTYKTARVSGKIKMGAVLAEEAYSIVDDVSTLADPKTSAVQKGLAAFDLITGFGDEAKVGLKALGVAESALITTSRVTLSRRMKKLAGNITPEGKQAHHMLPWKFRDDFWSAGIDINDTKYGIWLDSHLHQTKSKAYEKAWEEYLQNKHSAEDIVNKMKQLMHDIYGVNL